MSQFAQNDNVQMSDSLGADLRGLRKSRSVTLSELALKIDRSVGFLSQVERGLSSPSIEDLRAITSALDVPLGWFLINESENEGEQGVVVRANGRRALGTRETGLVEELLSPDLGGHFEMLRSVFEPRAEIKQEVKRETEEAGVIISGELEIWIDNQYFLLTLGDSFRFENKPYRWRNSGDVPAIVIWVVSPPVY